MRTQFLSMLKDFSWLYFCAALVIGCALRFLALGEIPPALFVDEMAIGVNAALIANYGIDQYAHPFPVLFRAIDDYKGSFYIYLTALGLLFTELSAFSVRLPAAVLGLVGIVATYVLTLRLSACRLTASFAALLLAVQPWHVHYSRIAWEATALPLLFTLFILFAWSAVTTGSRSSSVLAGIVLGLLPYTYSAAKLLFGFAAIFLGVLMLQRRAVKNLLLIAGSAFCISLPFLLYYLSHFEQVNLRLSSIRIPFSEMVLAYISYFSPDFLFLIGDRQPRHNPAGGMLHWYFPLLMLFALIDTIKKPTTAKRLLLFLVLALPLLGAPASDYPHATRTLVMTPFLAMFAAYGLKLICGFFQSSVVKILLLALLLCSTIPRWSNYFNDSYPLANLIWNAGQLDALRVASKNRMEGEELIISSKIHYIAWMFTELPQKQTLLENKDRIQSNELKYDIFDRAGKFNFLPISYPGDGRECGLVLLSHDEWASEKFLQPFEVLYENQWYRLARVQCDQ